MCKAWLFTAAYAKRAKRRYLLVVRKCKSQLQKGLPPCVGFPTLQMPAPELPTRAPSERRAPPTVRSPPPDLPGIAALGWGGSPGAVPAGMQPGLLPRGVPLGFRGERRLSCKGDPARGIWRGAFMPCCSHPGDLVRIRPIFHETSVKLWKQRQPQEIQGKPAEV